MITTLIAWTYTQPPTGGGADGGWGGFGILFFIGLAVVVVYAVVKAAVSDRKPQPKPRNQDMWTRHYGSKDW